MKKSCLYIIYLSLVFIATACHTGIESTKTITLTKSDRKQIEPAPEERFMADVRAPKLSEWEVGKKFLISDSRANMVFDAYASDGENLAGHEISFSGVTEKTTPGGVNEAVIVFTDGNNTLRYSTGKSTEDATSAISSMDVPMLIDLQLVEDAKQLLSGKSVWTRSQLWYDTNENKIDGRKFVPVTITNVSPGSMVFPLKISIKDENGEDAVLFMNISSGGIESRTFQSLFSLSDPKDRYPGIEADVWQLIQRGKVKEGMTKEECKLSLGNPSDVNSGHDWNSTIDFWQYPNGSYLRFQDGLLVSFRI